MKYIPRYLLVVMDRESERLIWANLYREWPRFTPGVATLSAFPYFSVESPTMGEINDLMARKDLEDKTKFIKVGPPVGAEFRRLLLLRDQCGLAWRWLNSLYQLHRSAQGFMPGVPLGLPGTNDRALYEQELAAVSEMIAAEIANHYWKIWETKNTDDLESLENHLMTNRQNNIQIYY